MTPFEQFIQSLASASFDPWILVKFLFLVALLIYIAFAVVVVRQVGLMSRTLDGAFNLPLKLIAWLHLGVAIGVWVLALVIL
jgi:hypothetical protein